MTKDVGAVPAVVGNPGVSFIPELVHLHPPPIAASVRGTHPRPRTSAGEVHENLEPLPARFDTQRLLGCGHGAAPALMRCAQFQDICPE